MAVAVFKGEENFFDVGCFLLMRLHEKSLTAYL